VQIGRVDEAALAEVVLRGAAAFDILLPQEGATNVTGTCYPQSMHPASGTTSHLNESHFYFLFFIVIWTCYSLRDH